MLHIVTLTYRVAPPALAAHLDAHKQWLRKHIDTGLFLAAGPWPMVWRHRAGLQHRYVGTGSHRGRRPVRAASVGRCRRAPFRACTARPGIFGCLKRGAAGGMRRTAVVVATPAPLFFDTAGRLMSA